MVPKFKKQHTWEKEKTCNPQELKDLIYRQAASMFQIKWAFSVTQPKKQPS